MSPAIPIDPPRPARPREAARILAPPLAGLLVIAALLHLVDRLDRPRPLPVTDADRTILHHQLRAAPRAGGADVLLVGDSSCLMDVIASDLGRATGRPVRNLGTFSYLGLPEFGDLAARALAARPPGAEPPTVVLLLHPRFLRLGTGDDAFVGMYHALASGRSPREPAGWRGTLARHGGAVTFRDRVETRLRPFPLRGAFGRHYGFHRGLGAHLEREDGSLLDPHADAIDPAGPPDAIPVAPRLEAAARVFRDRVPRPVRLLVGITPVPGAGADADAGPDAGEALGILRAWLDADAVLGNLPAAMPADQFATATHLNDTGRRAYTALLAAALAR